MHGGIYGCVSAVGDLQPESIRSTVASLRMQLEHDGMVPTSGPIEVLLMHSNEPGVLFRRTDVLVGVRDGFDLWDS